ncbi:MAG: hypothetical protein EON90_05660, partial [Brevundimonas sp.]
MSMFRKLLLTSAFVIFVTPSAAWADDWRLREASGAVRVSIPARAVAVGVEGQVLPIGASVTTGSDGRAVLFNGDQRIVVGPNSRTTLAPEAGGMTRVLQDLGSALFQVDRQRRPHFRVETPLLAAVVKGTTFTVSVDTQGDRVHVAEGLVEVRSNSGGSVGDVGAGATGFVSREHPTSIEMTASSAAITVDIAATSLAPVDYSALSGGLVENAAILQGPALPTGRIEGAAAGGGASGGSAASSGGGGSNNSGAGNGSASGTRSTAISGNAGNGNTSSGGGAPGGAAHSSAGGGNPGGGNAGGGAGNGNGGGNSGNSNGGGNAGAPGNSGGNPGDSNGGGNGGGNAGAGDGNSGNGNGGGNAGAG